MNSRSPRSALTSDQQHLVETIVNADHSRILVIAPPGTGKTYAVGAAVTQLLAERPARVLFLAPAALCEPHAASLKHWLQDSSPCHSHCWGLGSQHRRSERRWPVATGRVCHLIDLAKRDDMAARLTAAAWDLVVVDEAHGCMDPN